MDVRVGEIVTAVFKIAVRVSVPAVPPFSTSEEPRVCVAETREPSNESLPVPPVKLVPVFAPVVSGQVKCRRKSLIKKRFCYF